MSGVDRLFSDYVREHRAGGEADPRAFLAQASPEDLRPGGGVLPKRLLEPSEYELKLAQIGKRRPGESDQPWLSGTWTFPLYPTCWGAWAWLTLGVTVAGTIVRLMAAS